VTYRLLFLCTGNSARSQMAEAILNAKGEGRFEAASAGSQPAARVNPYALETLREFRVPWVGHPPRSIDGLEREQWDFVISVRSGQRGVPDLSGAARPRALGHARSRRGGGG
jgi:arsenate reductase